MGRILKGLFFLILLGFIGLVAYAYLGDLAPDQSEIREPVQIDVN